MSSVLRISPGYAGRKSTGPTNRRHRGSDEMQNLEGSQVNPPSDDDLESQAARFLIEQDNPEFSDEQRRELAAWLMTSEAHCHAYLRIVRDWRWNVVLYPGARSTAINRLLGNTLRLCREEKRLSVEEVARKAKCFSLEEIRRFENGVDELTLQGVMTLAPALQIAPSRLAAKLEQALSGADLKRARRPAR
jgi:hypothetical protein